MYTQKAQVVYILVHEIQCVQMLSRPDKLNSEQEKNSEIQIKRI